MGAGLFVVPGPAAGQGDLADRALVVSPESMPKEMMRVGWMRTMVSWNGSLKALPPDGTTVAVPRTSIMRGCHGGSTSSITMPARPVRWTSRSFLVWLIRKPPTSIASCSALQRNEVGTTCGCPSGLTAGCDPAQALRCEVAGFLAGEHAHAWGNRCACCGIP